MVGTDLGHYRIGEKLGSGGMGEVYRAHDTALNRDVAIKVLPESVADDADRLARFQREAEALAALNHPNIAQIHGLEKKGHTPVIVMELVEGPTLADRLKAGPLALDEALPIARQIAEALEAAHEHGIIHRDLKPANIKVKEDGTVKVLDFGLAKALAGPGGGSPAASLIGLPAPDALTSPAATQMGIVLGTAAYMAPEQAKGKPVDKRADIWAFGAVLYEMLTGRQLFDGADVSDVMARVIDREPDWSGLPAATPTAVRRLLRRSLVKERKNRLPDIGVARLEIDEAEKAPEPSRSPQAPQPTTWQRPRPWLVGSTAVLLALVAGAVGSRVLRPPPAPLVKRLDIALPADQRLPAVSGSLLAISPDGQHLVYVATSGGSTRLFHRRFDATESVALAGTEGAMHPFFSPDSRTVGFRTMSGRLATVDLEGGGVRQVSSFEGGLGYGVWRHDGTIVFGRGREGIWSVPATGGDPQRLAGIDADLAPDGYERMSLLPGGDVVVAEARRASVASSGICLVSLVTGQAVEVAPVGTDPGYLRSGHVMFARAGELWAVPVDADAMRATGTPVPVLGNVRIELGGAAHFDAADDGTMVHVAGSVARSPLFWVDRDGNETEIEQVPVAGSPRISPDGRKVAYKAPSADGTGTEIWVYDDDLGNTRRVTSGSDDVLLAWEPTGGRVLFAAPFRNPVPTVFRVPTDFSGGGIEALGSSSTSPAGSFITGGDVSPDGTLVVFQTQFAKNRLELLRVGSDEPVRVILESDTAAVMSPAISPDGKWLAYVSDESGRDEVFVTSFPETGRSQIVSARGGVQPVWSTDGRELLYRREGDVFTVPVELVPTLRVLGAPRRLFLTGGGRMPFRQTPDYDYDSASRRFVIARSDETATIRLNVILNFFEVLREKMSAGGSR